MHLSSFLSTRQQRLAIHWSPHLTPPVYPFPPAASAQHGYESVSFTWYVWTFKKNLLPYSDVIYRRLVAFGIHLHIIAQNSSNTFMSRLISFSIPHGSPMTPFSLGISFKTQALYVAVFVTRYPDLFSRFISFYNSIMKLFFIVSSCYILYLMRYRFRSAHF